MVLKNISPGCGVRASLMLFFYPGTSTSGLSSGVTVEGTGPSLVQTTGHVAVRTATQPVEGPGTRSCVAASKSATRPVEGPSTGVVIQQNATSLRSIKQNLYHSHTTFLNSVSHKTIL